MAMADKDEGAGERQLVVFSLAGEAYGVDVSTVSEIIRMEEITHVPNAPDYVEGVINLRGKVCPVIELRKRFDIELSDATNETRIVVVEIDGEDVGVIVDAVTEVLRISGDCVEPASEVIVTGQTGLVKEIVNLDDRLILLVDLRTALSDANTAGLTQMEAAAA